MKKRLLFFAIERPNISKLHLSDSVLGFDNNISQGLFHRFLNIKTLCFALWLFVSICISFQTNAQNLLNGSGSFSVTTDGLNQLFTVPLSTNAPNCTGQVSITFSYGLQNGNPNNGGCCNGNSSREMELSLLVNGTLYWVARSPNDDNTTTGIGTGGTPYANHQPANGATCSGCVTSSYPMLGSNQTLATNQTITLTLPVGVTLSAASSVQFRFNNTRIAGNTPEDNAIVNVTNISMPNCPAPCSAGTVAPTLSATTKSNVCPATTADLSGLVSSTCPVGSTLEWHSANTGLSAANKVTTPTSVAAGTYYPTCFDATNTCYSPVPATGVTVTINSCSSLCNINSTAFNVGLKANYNVNTITSCNTATVLPNTPFETTAIVQTDAQGKLGIAYVFWVNAQTLPVNNLPACGSSTSSSLVYQLYLKNSAGQCTGSPIPATVTNGGLNTGTYAGLNPEWSGLQPNTDYVIKVTGVVGSACINLFRSCLYYYQFPCSAGTVAPTLSATTKSNVCPATTADLSALVTSTCPVGSTLEWHNTNTGLSAANKVATPASVGAGTYYPTCFDATNACYSPVPATGVTVSITVCPDTDGDGVVDAIDLDDDNDGILDIAESACNPNVVYVMDLTGSVYSGFGTDGGYFDIKYILQSGTAIPSLGNTFNIRVNYSDFINDFGADNKWEGASTSTLYAGIKPNVSTLYTGLPSTNTTTENPTGSSFDIAFNGLITSGAIQKLGTFNISIGAVPNPAGYDLVSQSISIFTDQNAASSTNWLNGYYARLQNQTALNPVNASTTLPFTGSHGQSYTFDYTAFTNGSASVLNAGRGLIAVNGGTIIFQKLCDTDGDGIADKFDLDSDGDGCSDAIEGGATFTTANLVNSTMAGGNSGVGYTGTSSTPVTQNLGNTVGSTPTTLGVPTIANTGQTIGYSLNGAVNACIDTDGDGIANLDDLDDDNDGILDTVEDGNCEKIINGSGANGFTAWTQTGNVFSNTSPQFVFNYGETSPNGVMSQVISTVANQSLQLKFDAVGWGGNTSGNASVRVDVMDGSTVLATKTVTKLYGNPWTNETLNFTPTSTQTTIKFTDISTVTTQFDFVITGISVPGACDLDNDGLINSLDLDSDGDGCPDAIEGGANLAVSNLVNSTMAGGNSGVSYTGTSSSPVTKNLGNTVGTTPTTLGVPTIANTGQTVNNSQNKLVQSANCPATCLAGNNAPVITATTVTNTCPTTTFSLAALANTGTKPAGTTLVWSTHKVPTSMSDTLTNLTAVAIGGKYYALYFDKVANCYSPADSVIATLTICAVNPPTQSATNSQPKTGNAGTELSPTGGTGTYVYSVDNSGSCTPVVGATALPPASNLTITNPATGAYSYTAPSTAGVYYYCIKVCDTSSPTPSCTTKTYTLTVTCPVGSAVPSLK